jgi:hypothetical protein
VSQSYFLRDYISREESIMGVKQYVALIVLVCAGAVAPTVFADTYITFPTTRYYSANRRYFVVLTEKKSATLYHNGRGLRRVWSRKLQELPQQLFVTNDGKRVAMVDRYYGNGGSPKTPVVIILGENGYQIASHLLGDLTNLKRVVETTSSARWYGDSRLSVDGEMLMIDTNIMKRDWDECSRNLPTEARAKCLETVPYQQLRFSLSSGELIERVSLASK